MEWANGRSPLGWTPRFLWQRWAGLYPGLPPYLPCTWRLRDSGPCGLWRLAFEQWLLLGALPPTERPGTFQLVSILGALPEPQTPGGAGEGQAAPAGQLDGVGAQSSGGVLASPSTTDLAGCRLAAPPMFCSPKEGPSCLGAPSEGLGRPQGAKPGCWVVGCAACGSCCRAGTQLPSELSPASLSVKQG